MKAQLVFIIVILLLIILCFYLSKKKQDSNNKKKEKFESDSDIPPDRPVDYPLYSISLVSTPYLCYLKNINNNKLFVNSHLRIDELSIYIPIKIVPLCKFDTTHKKLLFYFFIDVIDDDEYDNYNGKLQDTKIINHTKYRNLPLLKDDGSMIYRYKVETDIDYAEFPRIKTDLYFMLPHITDPLDLSSNRDINKLLDIDMKLIRIVHTNGEINDNDNNNKITIPRLINSSEISSLKSLGFNVFDFNISPDDVEVTYTPSINYSETYQLSTDFYSYQKLNCAQVKVIIKNNKYLNIDNGDNKLKFKFILQSVKNMNNYELINNIDNYPNNIYNDETNFNINKTEYQLNFYISDTECHQIKDNTLQLLCLLYHDDVLSSGRSNPNVLYYEETVSIRLPSTIINRPADERILSNIQDTKAEDLLINYNVYPTFALNKEINVIPNEGFKDINKEQELKIRNKLSSTRIKHVFNKSFNYGSKKLYKKNNEILNESKNNVKLQLNIIKKYYNDKNLLKKFKIINFKTKENFQETPELVSSAELYKDNILIIDDIMMNKKDNNMKSFNSKMEHYIYPNSNNVNDQFNEVKITQYSHIRKDGPGLAGTFNGDNKILPLEFYRSDTSYAFHSYKLKDDNQLDVKFLLSPNLDNLLYKGQDLNMLTGMLNIKSTDKNYVEYLYNEDPQEFLYSNNLIFKAKSGNTSGDGGGGGVFNKLITPGTESKIDNGSPNIDIPNNFKLNVHNNTSKYLRGKEDSLASCNWKKFGMLILGAIILAILTIVTAGTALGPGLALQGTFAAKMATWAATAGAVVIGANVTTFVAVALLATSIAFMAVKETTDDHQLDGPEEAQLLDEINNEYDINEEKIKEQLSYNIDIIIKMLLSCSLNHKKRSATTEDFINIKCIGNIKQGSSQNTIVEHAYITAKKDGNESFNQPNDMHTDVCENRTDLLTIRQFKTEGNANIYDINIKAADGSNSIGFKQDNIHQHGSPNIKHVESFTYMSPDKNKDNMNSYIDLSDAGISLNNFGGLNYYEIYKNYISDQRGLITNGIINYRDEGREGKSIYTNTTEHGYPLENLININEDNNIHGKCNFVEECEAFYSTILKPYNVKKKSSVLDILEEILLFNGVNQLIITRQKNSHYSKSEELEFINESIIYDINKYLKNKKSTSESFNNISQNNNTQDNKSTISTNIQNKNNSNITQVKDESNLVSSFTNINNINRFPVNDPIYKFSSNNLNNFQDASTNIFEYNLNILNSLNELNVELETNDKILKSGIEVDDPNKVSINILSGEPTEEFKDTLAEESQSAAQYEASFEDSFITNHQELLSKFGRNSVILEGEHYYAKFPVIYQGDDFKVKGHKFYMTAELHEYPKEKFDVGISEANYVNNSLNHQYLSNSRLGTSVYNLFKWDDNDGFLKRGDKINFVIKIDKNIFNAQELSRYTDECRVGGIKQFGRDCRIILSDYNFLIVYFKNYNFDFNRKKLGESESFVYKKYPIELHSNETEFLVNLNANNSMVSNRYIARKIINNITMNQESFYGLREPKIPSLTDDLVHSSINQSEQDHDLYFCNDSNELVSLRVGYDDAGITGIEGICKRNAKTPKFGTINEDGSNSKVIPFNNNKIIIGSRDININYEDGVNDVFNKRDGTKVGKPYLNQKDGTLLKNYIHELAPFEINDNKVSINPNLKVGNDKEVFYVNNRKILGCKSSTRQKIIGFTALEGEKGRLADIGLLCNNLIPPDYTPTTTTKPVSNDIRPSIKPYRIKDDNNRYIGVDRKIDDNKNINYSIIFTNEPDINDHRFKFYISYFKNSDSLYYITSAKYLVENGENVLLTTTSLVNNTNQNSQVFNQLQYGDVDQSHAYQIKSLDEDKTVFNISATFVLDLDNTYCSIIPRTSSSKFECQSEKSKGSQFTLELMDKDLEKTKPTRIITDTPFPTKRPRDVTSMYGFDRNNLYSRIENRDKRLYNIDKNVSSLLL